MVAPNLDASVVEDSSHTHGVVAGLTLDGFHGHPAGVERDHLGLRLPQSNAWSEPDAPVDRARCQQAVGEWRQVQLLSRTGPRSSTRRSMRSGRPSEWRWQVWRCRCNRATVVPW